MRFKKIPKKGAMNLSVEAIIVFVLAFAMLGVGIFVTNQLRDIGQTGVDTSKDILASIEELPTAEKPIVGIKKDGLDLKANKPLDFEIGYYNKDRGTQESAMIVIDNCKSSFDGTIFSLDADGDYPVTVVSSTEDVDSSESVGFLLSVRNNGLVGGETYICKLLVMPDPAEAVTNPPDNGEYYYRETFFLNVRS